MSGQHPRSVRLAIAMRAATGKTLAVATPAPMGRLRREEHMERRQDEWEDRAELTQVRQALRQGSPPGPPCKRHPHHEASARGGAGESKRAALQLAAPRPGPGGCRGVS